MKLQTLKCLCIRNLNNTHIILSTERIITYFANLYQLHINQNTFKRFRVLTDKPDARKLFIYIENCLK